MNIVFLGAEVPSNRLLLESVGVKHMGFSFWRAWKRGLPKRKTYFLSDHFDSDVSIYVDWYNPEYDLLSPSERVVYDGAYMNFLMDNEDRITLTFPHPTVSFSKQTGVWPKLDNAVVSVSGELIETDHSLAAKVRVAKKDGIKFFAMGTGKPDNMRQVPFDWVSTLAWLSPMRHGETLIWDGTKLVRYPKSMRDQARRRYKAQVEKAGFDYDLFVNNDLKESSKVAIWSFLRLEEDLQKKRGTSLIVDNNENEVPPSFDQNQSNDVDNKTNQTDNFEVEEVINKRTISTLPGLVFAPKKVVEYGPTGDRVEREVQAAGIDDTSLRQCDTCFVAATCPAFKDGNSCAFKIPVEIRTREQLQALLTSIIEMQSQRVFFGRFAEEQNGGYMDPNLSSEMDRLFKLVKTMKEIEADASSLKVTVESKNSAGMLSAIFGEQAKKKELETPLQEPDVSSLMSSILDAEVIE